MSNKNFLVYDIEIINAIPPAGDSNRIPGIEYCSGWLDYKNIGISVICAYSYADKKFHTFTADTGFSEFQKMTKSAVVVGFNSESFDDNVCRANNIRIKTGYDILREIYQAKGMDPYPEIFTDEYKGYGLDAIAQANRLGKKSGRGDLAAIWWQHGKKEKVVSYCLQDVVLTQKIFDMVLDGKVFRCPVSGGSFVMQKP